MKFYKIILLALLTLAVACEKEKGTDSEDSTLAAPESVKLHSSTTTSLTFQWALVSNAASYAWQIVQDNTVAQSGSVTQRNVTVSDLTPGTTYKFGVASVGADGQKTSYTWLNDVSTLAESEEDPGDDDDPAQEPTVAYEDFLIPEVEEDGVARAFPGAEGGGMYTTGGRGGSVYHVTSLADDTSEGTLRYGIEKMGRPLTIVFDVAGVIPLTKQLRITNGDLTIAGQTAPGDGICLKNYTFRVHANNVIVRFIRCRMGDECKTEDDAIQVMSHDDDFCNNIIIDHCSVSWSTDECASFYGMKNFTFSWNIVSESLRVSIHNKGTHGYGGIWGGTDASYHHNLLAHHDSRNPRIDHDYVSTQKGPVSIVNNVVYNWRGNTCYGGESANTTNTYRKYNFVGNYYKPGPATSSHYWFIDPTTSCSNCTDAMSCSTIVPGHFYMTGNFMYGKSAISNDNWSGTTASSSVISTIKSTSPFVYTDNPSKMSLQSSEDAFNCVLAYAGASFVRDAIDERIADETKNGKATYKGSKSGISGLIDTQGDVGGWPEYSSTSEQREAIRDTDSDGIPNVIEDAWGLDKYNAKDGAAKTIDKNGRYTNLEMYLHYLVKDIVAGGNANATYGDIN